MESTAARPTPLFAYGAWAVALTAALGSIFFGEVMKLPPCTLCWYQRICLFPLVPVLGVAIVFRDRHLFWYGAPLAGAGLFLAAYHNLLYYGVIDAGLIQCTQGVPCTTRQIEWLGFVTIPLMALAAFVSILVFLILHERRERRLHP